MKIILKSILYSFYLIKMSWKNYLPVAFYLILSQFFVMYLQSPYLVLLFFIGYLAISSPLVINIFRNIILEDDIKNSYIEFFKKDYTKIFINRIYYLLSCTILIYIIHIIILSPFFPSDIPKMTIYLYILFAYMIYIYSRIMFILPGAACGLKKNLKDSYLFTKRESIKIYFLYLTLIVPYVTLNILLSGYENLLEYREIFVFISIIIQIIFTIISTALVGFIYKSIDAQEKKV